MRFLAFEFRHFGNQPAGFHLEAVSKSLLSSLLSSYVSRRRLFRWRSLQASFQPSEILPRQGAVAISVGTSRRVPRATNGLSSTWLPHILCPVSWPALSGRSGIGATGARCHVDDVTTHVTCKSLERCGATSKENKADECSGLSGED
jgi:hypothetical protein